MFYLWEHGIEMEDQGMSEDNDLERDSPICLQLRRRLHMHLFLLLGTNDFPIILLMFCTNQTTCNIPSASLYQGPPD